MKSQAMSEAETAAAKISSTRRIGRTLVAAIFALLLTASAAVAQTTTFSYQGRLTDGGTSANGTYDMQFKLYDSASVGSGNQIGVTITNGAVSVSSGVFTVQLDFAAAAFPGADRFVEIGVRPAGSSNPYTALSPRQQLTSAVYAIRAGATTTADTATNATQLGGVPANQYAQTNDGRLTDARPPTAGSSNYIQNSNNPQQANFNLTGNGTVGGQLQADQISSATQYSLKGVPVLAAPLPNNLFVGFYAGISNTTGFSNAFFGTSAGVSNTTGLSNSFFGSNVATKNTTGSGNSFFGSDAGTMNTTGGSLSIFGASAGQNNTTGVHNSFFGASAGIENTTGRFNSFVGSDAGHFNTTADNNSFFGYSSGALNGTGVGNSFFGARSGLNNTTGVGNAFFGAAAGAANTTNCCNAYFGNLSGTASTGVGNAFFGNQTGQDNTTGSGNSFFGNLAGLNNTTANNNAFYGASAGAANTTGLTNSFIGSLAGLNNTTGLNNSFVGGFAGDTNVTGSNNTLIGRSADVGSSNLIFATAIGAGSVVSSSNTIMLGRANAFDTVRVVGALEVDTLSIGGLTTLCRNSSGLISTCSSSLRYKKDLHPFSRGLSLLNQLKPITFKWKSDGSEDLGFGAEDVAAVEPLLVTHNAAGEVEGVKYDRITAVLVNAVKEQQQQIQRQQEQLNRQQSEIQTLKQMVRVRRSHGARSHR